MSRSNNRTLFVWKKKFTLERPKFANFNSAKTSKITISQTLISANISSFTVSNSVMLSSDNGNILIIGFSFQGAVLNVFFSVFNVIRYNSNGIL